MSHHRTTDPAPPPLAIYIASARLVAPLASDVAVELQVNHGCRVTSTWHEFLSRLDADERVADPTNDPERLSILGSNLTELQNADYVVFLAHVGDPNAARTEVGYALATRKPVVWVHKGERGRNIFDTWPGLVQRVDATTITDSASLARVISLALEELAVAA